MSSLEALAALVAGRVDGDPQTEISGLMPLEWASPGTISFYANPKYLEAAQKTHATALLAKERFAGAPKNLILCDDPYLGAAQLAQHFFPPERRAPAVHASAVIDPSARIGTGVFIGPLVVIEAGAEVANGVELHAQCYVGENASIGRDAILYPGVKVLKACQVGARSILHSGVVLGSDGFGFAENKTAEDGKRRLKIPQLGFVEVGDDVEIGANTTIDRATFGVTRIGDGTKIDNLVQIGHNVETGTDCVIVSQAGIAGSTKLGKRVILGGQAGIVGHIKLGDDVMVNAQSGVNRSLEAGAAVSGSPVLPYRDWQKQQMALLKIDEIRRRVFGIKKG